MNANKNPRSHSTAEDTRTAEMDLGAVTEQSVEEIAHTKHMTTPVDTIVTHAAGRLRYPKLLALTATVFVVDLLIPDFIPFVDEILLGLGTLLLSRLRTRRPPAPE